MLTFWGLHELDKDAAHVPGVDEDHRRTMGADPRDAIVQNGGALGGHVIAGRQDVLNLEADMC